MKLSFVLSLFLFFPLLLSLHPYLIIQPDQSIYFTSPTSKSPSLPFKISVSSTTPLTTVYLNLDGKILTMKPYLSPKIRDEPRAFLPRIKSLKFYTNIENLSPGFHSFYAYSLTPFLRTEKRTIYIEPEASLEIISPKNNSVLNT